MNTPTKQELKFMQDAVQLFQERNEALNRMWQEFRKETNKLILKMIQDEHQCEPSQEHHAVIQIGKKGLAVTIGHNNEVIDHDYLRALKELKDYAQKKGGHFYLEYGN